MTKSGRLHLWLFLICAVFAPSVFGTGMTFQPDAKTVVSYNVFETAGAQFVVRRFMFNGSFDTGFGHGIGK